MAAAAAASIEDLDNPERLWLSLSFSRSRRLLEDTKLLVLPLLLPPLVVASVLPPGVADCSRSIWGEL